MKHTITKWINSIMDLIYPPICPCCQLALDRNSRIFCTSCQYYLKETDLHLYRENLFTQHFWGRIYIKTGAGMFLYQKGGKVQQLIKAIKYGHRKDLAFIIGLQYGKHLIQSDLYQGIDLIIPVPLHKQRLKKRGYNQSYWFAKGLSASMNVGLEPNVLIRRKGSHSQTIKNRIQRNSNLQNVFGVKNPHLIKHKNILLVDDVLTTGATLESCANQLNKYHINELTMATIAVGIA